MNKLASMCQFRLSTITHTHTRTQDPQVSRAKAAECVFEHREPIVEGKLVRRGLGCGHVQSEGLCASGEEDV